MADPGFIVTELELSGAKLIETPYYRDERGYFSVPSNDEAFEQIGIRRKFVQDNQSLSVSAGTVRGLHYQLPPFAQAKLIRVLSGRILDVVVDARYGSPTYGRHCAMELSAENGLQVYAPRGFLHGFMTLVPNTTVFYKVDNTYAPGHDRSISWNDPALAIEWPTISTGITLSEKDRSATRWAEMGTPFEFGQVELDGEAS